MTQPTQSLADLRRDIVMVNYEKADTATPVKHKIGRKPVGFVKINQSVAMSIYQTAEDANATTDEVLVTRSTATGTAKIEVI